MRASCFRRRRGDHLVGRRRRLAQSDQIDGGWTKTLQVALVLTTVISAWAFIHTLFALHYASEYCRASGAVRRVGLDFPGAPDRPGGIDFLYFSFVIGCAAQTADISTTSTSMRALALAQGIVAFVFNTFVLALTVNIAAGLF